MTGSSIAVSPTSCGPALRRFAAGLRWRHVCGQGLSAILRWGLLLSAPLVGIAWLVPGQLSVALSAAAALLLLVVAWVAVRAYWRGRKILGALLQLELPRLLPPDLLSNSPSCNSFILFSFPLQGLS